MSPGQLSPIALGATLPPFLQGCCAMTGGVGTIPGQEQDFEVPTARTPGKPTVIVIALRDDFRPGQSITRVVDKRSGAPYSLVAGTSANGLIAAAYAKIATVADGAGAIVSLSTRTSFDQPAVVLELAFVAQRASGFGDHASTSVESPGDAFVMQPSFTPSVGNELVVSVAAFTAPVTGTTVDPARGDPFFFHNGEMWPSRGPGPGMTVSFAYGTAGQPTGVRRLRAFGGPVTQDAVLVFGVLPQEFDLSQELIEAGFGEDGIVGIPVAEPVNALTGNPTLSSVDLSLPGRGPSLRLSRTFNGRDTRVAPSDGDGRAAWSGASLTRARPRRSRAATVAAMSIDGRSTAHTSRRTACSTC